MYGMTLTLRVSLSPILSLHLSLTLSLPLSLHLISCLRYAYITINRSHPDIMISHGKKFTEYYHCRFYHHHSRLHRRRRPRYFVDVTAASGV